MVIDGMGLGLFFGLNRSLAQHNVVYCKPVTNSVPDVYQVKYVWTTLYPPR